LTPYLRRHRLLNLLFVFLSLNAAAVVALFKYSFQKMDATWKQ